MIFFLMIRLTPISTRTYTPFPYTTLVRSLIRNRKSALYFSVTQILTQYNTRAFWESEVRSPAVKQGKRNWPNGQCAVWCVTAMPSQGDLRSLGFRGGSRSAEHTSELQSPMRISNDVFCLKQNTNCMI